MKNIYTLFLIGMLILGGMSFTINNHDFVVAKAHGIQKNGQNPGCTPSPILQACAESLVSLAEFQSQRRAKTDNEFEFNMRLNKKGEVVLEFNKNDVSQYVNAQPTRIKYYKISENINISDANLLSEMGYTNPVLTLPKGDYPLKAGLVNYSVIIPISTTSIGQ